MEESHDPKKILLLQSRPSEPLHDMYRKGFSYLHVPDFQRQAVAEERSPQKLNSNQTIDDIISGIIHLLGGDVHVTRAETRLPSIFPPSLKPVRINDRGPADFDVHKHHGRPVTPDITTPTYASSVIVGQRENYSTNHQLFPKDTNVSKILGLTNETRLDLQSTQSKNLVSNRGLNTNFIDSGNVSSEHLKVIEIIPSVESDIHSTLLTLMTLNTTETSMSHGTQITPTSVLTELDENGHTFIETVISEAPFIGSSSSNGVRSLPPTGQNETTAKLHINYTDIPILLLSRNFYDSETSESQIDLFPSEPVTDWLPVTKPPERNRNSHFTTTYMHDPDELIIITHQPDDYKITVTHQMYSNKSNSQTGVIPSFTSIITPIDVISTTDISVSIVSTQVDIIYGRPSISSALSPPLPAMGMPHVFTVNIEEVRSSKRPNMYPRPRPPNILSPTSNHKNELRPLPGASRPSIFKIPPLLMTQPPKIPEIRIDTCVVGDDSTCDVQLKEQCRTERGVSACLCRPGYGRTVDRGPCTSVVSMLLTLKVAKLGNQNIDPTHFVPGSPEYQRLNYEASHAMSSVFLFSPLAKAFRGSQVNRIYFIAHRMVINSTIYLDESEVRGSLRHHVEHSVSAAISRRDSRLGTSQLFVSGPLSALVEVEDLNECGDRNLNDCSEFAICDNLFGTFQCQCKPGYTDKFEGDPRNAGRICSACSPDFCNGKGQCIIIHGRQECRCRGNYAGSRCQVDNEVIGVSVGVSVIAIIVIAITATCLYLWNRRWKQAHQKQEIAKSTGYRLQTMTDHVRWGAASTFGSIYEVPSDLALQLPPLTPSTSQLYAISAIPQNTQRHLASRSQEDGDVNPYGRIIRTMQKHNSLNLHYDALHSECTSSDEIGFPSVPSNSFVYHGNFPEQNITYR